MTTGKIEFAPDYKSNSATEVAARIDNIIRTDLNRQRERQRLESEVVEASKAEHQAQKIYLLKPTPENVASYHDAKDQRQRAVDALMEFEAKQE